MIDKLEMIWKDVTMTLGNILPFYGGAEENHENLLGQPLSQVRFERSIFQLHVYSISTTPITSFKTYKLSPKLLHSLIMTCSSPHHKYHPGPSVCRIY